MSVYLQTLIQKSKKLVVNVMSLAKVHDSLLKESQTPKTTVVRRDSVLVTFSSHSYTYKICFNVFLQLLFSSPNRPFLICFPLN
jgi:hypothetical protein